MKNKATEKMTEDKGTSTEAAASVVADKKRPGPVHKLQDGALRAAIWANHTKDGKTIYNATFSRFYRDGETLRNSSSFGQRDLLVLAKLADSVHSWIASQYVKKAA